jgi:circadian clock protein KaiB
MAMPRSGTSSTFSLPVPRPENLKGRYSLEVVDIYDNPEATRDLQIVASPTLVKVLPEPLRRIIGDLSDTERVLAGLDIRPLDPG